MGINDFIASIFSNWRKRKINDDEAITSNKKVKLGDYSLTPLAKDVVKLKERVHYNLGEELDATESRQVEYKEGGFIFKKDVLIQHIKKYASAFLNSEGGVLLAGVNDKGIVKGIYVTSNEYNTLVQTLRLEMDKFRPFVPPSLYSCKTYPVINNNKKTFLSAHPDKMCVVEFSFKKGIYGELYETGDHLVYLRRDGGVQGPLRPLHIKNFVISRYNSTLKDRKENKLKDDKQKDDLKERLQKKNIPYITID